MPSASNKVVLVNAAKLEEVLQSALEDSTALLVRHVKDMGERADPYTVLCHKDQIKNCMTLMMIVNPSFDRRPYEQLITAPLA